MSAPRSRRSPLRAGPAIENARRFREARHQADLDALTGLHNRRYFHETLARETARAQRYNRRLALIVFDLDDFKAINDRIGHLAGDTVLAEVAERVRDVVRHCRHRLPRRRRRVRGDPARVDAGRRRAALPPDPVRGLVAADLARRAAPALGRHRRAPAAGRPGRVLPARRRRALPREGRRQGPGRSESTGSACGSTRRLRTSRPRRRVFLRPSSRARGRRASRRPPVAHLGRRLSASRSSAPSRKR